MTARFVLLSLLALAAAACQPAADPAPAATPQTGPPAATPTGAAPAPDLIASAESLAGDYRVAGVDGADIDLPHGVTATIDGGRIEVTSDCIRLAWSYRFENGAVTTERVPAASCRRALLPEEEAIAAAFDAAGLVRRTPSNGVEFTGGEHAVLLFSQ